MAMNAERRDELRDAAIEVLAGLGGRGLTHRAVDERAGVPEGTTKNYFATRDALLTAVAERCVERYLRELGDAMGEGRGPRSRRELVALLRAAVQRATNERRSRLIAYLELQAEAARNVTLRRTLAVLARADHDAHAAAQRAAGLAVTPARVARFLLALNGALTAWITYPPELIEELGLADVDRFLTELLDAVYPVARGVRR